MSVRLPTARARGLSFRLKITLLAVIVAVVPVVAVGWLVSEVNRDALADANRQLIDAVIENLSTTASATIDDADTALVAIGGSLEDSEEARAAVVEAALDISTSVREIAIYDEEGVLITTLESVKPFVPPSLPATLPAGLRTDGVHTFGPVQFAGVETAGREPFVLRTYTITKARRYTVAGYIALRPIADRAISIGLQHLASGGHIVVVTPEGVAIADSLDEQVGATLGRDDVAMLSMFDPSVLASKSLYSTGDYRKANGTPMVGALRSIDKTPFTIAVEMPHDVVFHSIASVRRYVLVAVIVALIIAIAAGVILARRVTRPIKALVDYAGELAKRNFDGRVTIRARDELGVLGDALERAATDLQASDKVIHQELAIRNDMRRYLPSSMVDQIVARKHSLALGGARRDVTVLFADVVGFTPLAERESAETVVSLLNGLFTILTEIVFRHGGTVDKFVGDCVMAVWGASEDQPDHAHRAALAARDMLRWLEVGNEMWLEQFGFSIELAIGVNSGEAVVGNFGSETRMEYTAIGDVVNLAARLESIARPNQILTTAATRDRALAAGDTGFVSLGVRSIVGKAQPIELFEVRS